MRQRFSENYDIIAIIPESSGIAMESGNR